MTADLEVSSLEEVFSIALSQERDSDFVVILGEVKFFIQREYTGIRVDCGISSPRFDESKFFIARTPAETRKAKAAFVKHYENPLGGSRFFS